MRGRIYSRAFTLIELITVIVILGIFVSIISPRIFDFYNRAQVRADIQALCSRIQQLQARAVTEIEAVKLKDIPCPILDLQGETIEEITFGFELVKESGWFKVDTWMYHKNEENEGVETWEHVSSGTSDQRQTFMLSDNRSITIIEPDSTMLDRIRSEAEIAVSEELEPLLWKDNGSEQYRLIFNHAGQPTKDGNEVFEYAVICLQDTERRLHAVVIHPVTGTPVYYELGMR